MFAGLTFANRRRFAKFAKTRSSRKFSRLLYQSSEGLAEGRQRCIQDFHSG
ncbi:MAG: hypothetical protein PV344_08335 [Anaplasma sp.]|nr:hypothetical protein [Anaplasma sp.]